MEVDGKNNGENQSDDEINRENGMEERSDEDTSDCGGTTSHSVSNGSEESEDGNEESLNTDTSLSGVVKLAWARRLSKAAKVNLWFKLAKLPSVSQCVQVGQGSTISTPT